MDELSISDTPMSSDDTLVSSDDTPMSTAETHISISDSSDEEDTTYQENIEEENSQRDCESLHNIFMLHPNFNSKNIEFQSALQGYQKCFRLEKGYDIVKVQTPIITVPIVDPLNSKQETIIRAAADTGSEIQCFGPQIFAKYNPHGVVKYCLKGQPINTGNGKIKCHRYIPVKLKTTEGKTYEDKFWYLESLPQPFDWLIGVDLLSALGWRLSNQFAKYEHTPTNVDDINDDLDDLACSYYPIFEEKDTFDVETVHVKLPELRSFVHSQIRKHRELFAEHEWDSGHIQRAEYPIDFIEEDHPLKSGFYSKEYYMPPTSKAEAKRQIKGMAKHRVIRRCKNPQYVSSVFAVPKKTGDVRLVFDYRKLNQITKKIQYPIPNMDELLSQFKDKCVVSSLDLKGGYWHIPIREQDKHYTCFLFDGEVWEWNVLPFGPMNAPMFFQRIMNSIFAGLDYVTVYLDDISILSESVEEHKKHLQEVFKRLKVNNMKLRIDKCIWGVDKTEYLGFIVDKTGLNTKEKYVKKIMDVPEPTTRKALQRFNGLCQYLHRFIPNMHKPMSILSALTQLTNPKQFVMNEEQRTAFQTLKHLIFTSGGVKHPDPKKTFHVFTDASQIGIGGMLAQYHENLDSYEPIAYCSKIFNKTQQKWHVSEQELYAAIYCIEKWERSLRGNKFILHTDHKNLEYLFSKAGDFKSGKLFRWAVRLQDFHFECRYIKGEDNTVADWLSRESALLQQSKFAKIQEFYNKVPSHNAIRQQMSNDGGVDIFTLHTQHLLLSVINPGEVIPDSNPYEILRLGHQHLLPIRKKKDFSSKAVIPQTSVEALLIEESPPAHVQPRVKPRFPEPSSDDDGGDTPPPAKPQRSCKEAGNRKRRKILGIPEPDEDPNILRFKPLKRQKHQKFTLGDIVGVGKNLKHDKLVSERRHKHREKIRAQHKAENQKIIDSKPWEPTWNKDILHYNSPNPILDDYAPAIINPNASESRKWLRVKQKHDVIASIIFEFLKTGNNAHIEDLTEHLKRYVLSGRFEIREDNILCFVQTFKEQVPDTDPVQYNISERLLQFAPASFRKSLMKLTHSTMHDGRSVMVNKIQKHWKYWWPGMRKDIALWCESCNTCQHVKEGGYKAYKRAGKLKLFAATRPFEQISVDIVGSLPTTISGYRYIVTMIDKFSRYCMFVPVEDIRAISIIKAIDRWITTFGPPKSILSDNGPQFISGVYNNYMKNHKDVKKRYTTTYHPECNGQIERLHRWLKERLRLIAYKVGLNFADGTDDWSDHLGIIQYAHNISPSRATTYSAQEILFGRDDYAFDYTDIPDNPVEYVDYLEQRQRILHKKVVSEQAKYDRGRKKSADKKKKNYTLEIGQKVLWNINSTFVGNKKKFGPRWIGPYEIINIFNDGNNYKLKVIDLPNPERLKAMNKHKIPRRRKHMNRTDSSPITEFTVPRSQIKPYFQSYDERNANNESPASFALRTLQSSSHRPLKHSTDDRYASMRPVTWNGTNQRVFEIDNLHKVSVNELTSVHHLILKMHDLTLDSESAANAYSNCSESENEINIDVQQRYQAVLALRHLHHKTL